MTTGFKVNFTDFVLKSLTQQIMKFTFNKLSFDGFK